MANQPTVLIVEDDQYLLSLYAKKFSNANFIVYSARDGMTALRNLEKYKPQVVIVDLNIPELSGWDLLEMIAVGILPKPICVVLSNYDRATAQENQPLPDIIKDYSVKINTDPDELIQKVKSYLTKN